MSNRIISVVAAVVCVWICAVCFLISDSKQIAIICIAPFVITSAFLILNFAGKFEVFLKKRGHLFLAVGLVLMFTAELAFALANKQLYSLECQTWDFGNVMASAESSAAGGAIDKVYFARYPNNTALMLVDTLICRTVIFVTGGTAAFYPAMITLNCLMITAAVLFITLSCARLRGVSCGALGFLVCVVFLPFYLITPNVYSDVPAMLCFAAGSYFTVRHCETEKRRYAAAVGIICGVGATIKVTTAILVIALIIVLLFTKKNRLKRAGAVVLPFAAVMILLSLVITVLCPTTAEESEKYRFPYVHWVMMGLSSDGLYNNEDLRYTIKAGDYSEKQVADCERISERLDDYGFFGTVKHLFYTKTASSWTSGSFGTLGTLSFPQSETLLNTSLTEGGALYVPIAAYSLGLYWVLMLLTAAGALLSRKKELDAQSVMRLSIIGLYAFLMFWEGSSRYVFQIMPIVLMLGAVASVDVREKACELRRCKQELKK